MRYSKNQFTLVPNKDKRKGLSPILQTLFMWLCDHSDKDMKSFPSRKTLAEECGMSINTLDRAIQKLVSLGMVVKSRRYNNSEPTSNLYEVVLFTPEQAEETPTAEQVPPHRGEVPPETTLGTPTAGELTQPIKLQPIKLTTNVVAKAYGNPEINDLFNYWQQTTGIAISSRLTQNRRACSNLIKKHGVEAVQRLIGGVAQTQNDQYAPGIADFEELQNKLSKLLVWGKKKSKKGTVKI